MTEPTGAAGEAVAKQQPSISIGSRMAHHYKTQRDQLEVVVVTLTEQLRAAQAQIAELEAEPEPTDPENAE